MNLNILLVTTLFIVGCSKAESVSDAKAETISDISYGADAQQKFDLYLPAARNSTDTKLLILIHGGGWSNGDKSDFNLFISELQKRLPDFAIANLNYRLAATGKNLFPTQENDVKLAVEYLVTKSSQYGYSKNFAMLGASVGAHLALLHSYKYDQPVKIKAVVSLFGPTELVSLYNNPPSSAIPALLSGIAGGSPNSHENIFKQSSPYNFINAQSPPTLLLHGGKDPLVPASQSILVKEKLSGLSVFNQYIYYPNEGHGWTGASMIDSFDKIEQFLEGRF